MVYEKRFIVSSLKLFNAFLRRGGRFITVLGALLIGGLTSGATLCIEPEQFAAKLYDGSNITHENVDFPLKPEHVRLEEQASAVVGKNVATFSLTFFGENKPSKKKKVIILKSNKNFHLTFNPDNFSYNHAIGLLYEHTAHHLSFPDKVMKTMLNTESNRASHISQILHHSEQWVLIYLRDHIKDYIYQFLSENPEVNTLNGICVNIYSTNDPCLWCANTIKTVVPMLRNDVLNFLEAGDKIEFDGSSFSFFATVSSSQRYARPKPPLVRPLLEELEQTQHYGDFYSRHPNVTKGPTTLQKAKGKILHFWTPKPSYKRIKKLELEFSFSDGKSYLELTDKGAETKELIDILDNPPIPLRKIDLSKTKSKKFTSFDCTSDAHLKKLILTGCAVSSGLSFPIRLTHLDLDGTLVEYKDETASSKDRDKWKRRQGLFTSISKLHALRYLSLARNEVGVDEFEWLTEKTGLPGIITIVLCENDIFYISSGEVMGVLDNLVRFLKAHKSLEKIELTNQKDEDKKYESVKEGFKKKFSNENRIKFTLDSDSES